MHASVTLTAPPKQCPSVGRHLKKQALSCSTLQLGSSGPRPSVLMVSTEIVLNPGVITHERETANGGCCGRAPHKLVDGFGGGSSCTPGPKSTGCSAGTGL